MTIEKIAQHFTEGTVDRSGRFEEMAGAVYAFQRAHNRVYGLYGTHQNIPYLPVDAFKRAALTTFSPKTPSVSSKAVGRGRPVFFPPPWMRFRIVDPEHPDREMPEGQPGVLALSDLANLYSVSAILTEDRAVRRGEGFEGLGRLSQAELRGCNFLVERI